MDRHRDVLGRRSISSAKAASGISSPAPPFEAHAHTVLLLDRCGHLRPEHDGFESFLDLLVEDGDQTRVHPGINCGMTSTMDTFDPSRL